jgi:hypothetical protein
MRIKIRCYKRGCSEIARIVWYANDPYNPDPYCCIRHMDEFKPEPRYSEEPTLVIRAKGFRESFEGAQSQSIRACHWCNKRHSIEMGYEEHDEGDGCLLETVNGEHYRWCSCERDHKSRIEDFIEKIN